jgi:hypothetical protein
MVKNGTATKARKAKETALVEFDLDIKQKTRLAASLLCAEGGT